MTFYDALKFVLTTANGRIRRKDWPSGVHISKGFKQDCMSIIVVDNSKEKITYERYTATPEDMIAEDWCLIVD